MEYSAGMVSQVFAFLETKKLADLLNQGMSKDEAWKEVEENNLFQLRNATRLKRTFNYVYNRLSSLPGDAVKMLTSLDVDSAKILVLISIMKTDLLFFEFVYEVFRGKVLLGEKTIENRDINGFFDEKANQSDIVSNWSETGIQKLKNCYIKNLVDGGLLTDTKTRTISPTIINYKLEELLKEQGMETYLNAAKGER